MDDSNFLDRLLEISNNGIRSIETINNRINLIEDLLLDLRSKIDGSTQPGIAENLRNTIKELEIFKEDMKQIALNLQKIKDDQGPLNRLASLETKQEVLSTEIKDMKKLQWAAIGVICAVAGKLIYGLFVQQ